MECQKKEKRRLPPEIIPKINQKSGPLELTDLDVSSTYIQTIETRNKFGCHIDE